MITKVQFAPALAAVFASYQATAISIQSSQVNQSVMQALMDIYTQCTVQISSIAVDVQQQETTMTNSVSIDFTGIDESLCPDLTATIWLETPENYGDFTTESDDSFTVVIDPEQMVNGVYTHDFQSQKVSGEYFVHATVSPYGFECALPITDSCQNNIVSFDCNPQITTFNVDNSINESLGPADEYYGPNGINHELNFAVANLDNCDVYAYYEVQSLNFTSLTNGTMSVHELAEFEQTNMLDSWFRLQTDTTYAPYNYLIQLKSNADDSVYTNMTAYLENPHPACTLGGSLQIQSVNVNSLNELELQEEWIVEPSYTCHLDNNLTSSITSDDVSETPVEVDLETPQNATILAVGYPTPVWANFPMMLGSTLHVVGHQDDPDEEVSGDIDAEEVEFWPDCEFDAGEVYLTYSKEPVQDTENSTTTSSAFDQYTLVFNASASDSFNNFCAPATGSFSFYLNGERKFSQFVQNDDIENPVASQSTAFEDGEWCVDFTITLDAAKPGYALTSTTPERACVTVVAEPCEIVTYTSIDGVKNNATNGTILTWSNHYELNSWCMPGNDSYEYTLEYRWQQGEWRTAEEDAWFGQFKTELYETGWYNLTSEVPLEDIHEEVRFRVDYNGMASSTQEPTFSNSSDSYIYVTTCHPIIAEGMPLINNFTLNSNNSVDLYFDVEFQPADLSHCGEMKMKYEIYQDVNGNHTLIHSTDNITSLDIFTNQVGMVEAKGVIPDTEACYEVKVFYGEVDDFDFNSVSSISQKMCYQPEIENLEPCSLTPQTPTLTSINADDARENLVHSYDVYTSYMGDCFGIYGYVELNDTDGNTWVSDTVYNQSASIDVIQTSNFNSENYQATVYWFSSTSGGVNSIKSYDFQMPDPQTNTSYCQFNLTTDAYAESDTLDVVNIVQTHDLSVNRLCGQYVSTMTQAPTNQLEQSQTVSGSNDVEPSQTVSGQDNVTLWSLDSVTSTYNFVANLNFSDYSWWSNASASTSVDWQQGCIVQIQQANIVGFSDSDLTTNTSAKANLFLQGKQEGDCGGEDSLVVTAVLDQIDEVKEYNLTVDVTEFLSTGVNITQDVEKISSNYSLTVTIDAPLAESIEEHLSRTTGSGYINQISDTKTTYREYSGTTCQLQINDFTFEGYEEQGDWSMPVNATFSGEIQAISTCKDILGSITVYDESGLIVGTSNITEGTQNGTTYNFDFWPVEISNKKGSFYGVLYLTDLSSDAEPQTASTNLVAYQPPCYPEIVLFEKVGQTDSLDHTKVTLDFGLQLATHGDQACVNQSANIKIMTQATNQTNFMMRIDETDIQKALDGVFNFSVAISSDAAESAQVTFDADDATEPAIAFISDVYSVPETVDCSVNVIEFCLTDIEPINATATGVQPYELTFELDVEFNAACGELSGSIDLVADGEYLTDIVVDNSQILNAFECQCNSTLTVQADFDGSALSGASFYGQLDVRNGMHDVVLVTDSCSLDME